jgi:hypothetical protein
MTDDNQDILTAEDRELFLDITKEIRKNPTKFREAGNWLDEYCTEDTYWQRQENNLKELQRKKKEFPVLENIRRVEQLELKIKERQSPALYIRFKEAQNCLLKKYKNEQFITEDDAKQITLITWLLTDPDAEKADIGITELEKWLWDTTDDITKISRRFAQSLWIQSKAGYKSWMKLVRISWTKISAGKQHKTSSSKSNRIVGDTWSLAGITINCKNLISWMRKLHGWRKFVAYSLFLLLVTLAVGYYTRTLWAPLINRIRSNSNVMKESAAQNKLSTTLREICQDIDSRPLLQREGTAKQYIGISVENERLILYDARETGNEQKFSIIMIIPKQANRQYVTGRYISFIVDKEKYPELVAAKQGLEIYVSGRIEYAGVNPYIRLSEVSLRFE